MLQAEIDVYSGMPNPTFDLSEQEEAELLDRLVSQASPMSATVDETAHYPLGYRGVIIRQLKPDAGPWSTTKRPEALALPERLSTPAGRLPIEFRLDDRQAGADSTASWLIETARRKRVALSDGVEEAVRRGVTTLPSLSESADRPYETSGAEAGSANAPVPEGATWWACNSPFYSVNHDIFNNPAYVGRNNCYCFASNVLANVRFARPGRRGGRPAIALTCGACIDGLRADGWVEGCQVNTLTIAMVIWPNEDYHFYRVVTGGPDWWWEHKPGGTPARWTDEASRPLFRGLGPVNCNRGDYIHFCGYFYQNNYTAHVA